MKSCVKSAARQAELGGSGWDLGNSELCKNTSVVYNHCSEQQSDGQRRAVHMHADTLVNLRQDGRSIDAPI